MGVEMKDAFTNYLKEIGHPPNEEKGIDHLAHVLIMWNSFSAGWKKGRVDLEQENEQLRKSNDTLSRSTYSPEHDMGR